MILREQVRTGLRELHEGSALMQFEPAAFDREREAGSVFRGRALIAKQERPVDFLNVDPAILNGFEGASVLQQPETRPSQGRGRGGRRSVSKAESHVFQCLVNGTA